MMNTAAKKVSSLLDKAKPRWGGGRYEGVINRMKQTVEYVEQQTREASEAFEMFLPFTVENAYSFAQTMCARFSIASAKMKTQLLDLEPGAVRLV